MCDCKRCIIIRASIGLEEAEEGKRYKFDGFSSGWFKLNPFNVGAER